MSKWPTNFASTHFPRAVFFVSAAALTYRQRVHAKFLLLVLYYIHNVSRLYNEPEFEEAVAVDEEQEGEGAGGRVGDGKLFRDQVVSTHFNY